MKIDTTRFGEIDIKESELIVMRGPIFGFERLSRFVLLFHNNNTPLWWLQSTEDPSIAFVVVNPRIVKPDYNPTIFTEDVESLDIKSSRSHCPARHCHGAFSTVTGNSQSQGAYSDQCRNQNGPSGRS